MSILFDSRKTESARRMIEGSICPFKNDPADGKHGWMTAFLYVLTRQHEKALSEGQGHLTASEEIQGDNSQEVACGLAVLKLIYTEMKRPEEAASMDERFESIRDHIGDVSIADTMIEAFYDRAVACKSSDDPKGNQRAFIMACAALALSVLVYEGQLPSKLTERLFLLFRSLGFPPDRWGWLTRRCDFRSTDFVGLISVLIDGGMFPGEANELPDLSESEPADGSEADDYKITRMIDRSWMSFGFSDEFLLWVADGELSMRVERFAEEGARCLREIGDLSAHVLLFSSQSAGKHISVLEQDISSEEKVDLFNKILGGLLFQHGADSVMAIDCTSMRIQRLDKSLMPSLGSDTDDEITVEARDSKSYISGRLKVRRSAGRCVVDDLVLSDAEDGVLSKFTLPIKPGKKSPGSEA